MANSRAADRWAGLACIVFAALLFLAVIPWQVETVDYGWLRPRTLPRILAVIIGVCGLWLVLQPTGDAAPGAARWLRSGLFALVLIVALALTSRFGFVPVAPVLALAIMLLSGERRPLWLGLGVAGLPALIWFCVAVLLERPLP